MSDWQVQIVTKRSLNKRDYIAKGVIRLSDGFCFAYTFREKSLRLARVGLKKTLLERKKLYWS